MQISETIQAFSTLGNYFENFVANYNSPDPDFSQTEFNSVLHQAKVKNSWFDIDNQLFAFKSWASALREENLKNWTSNYNFPADNPVKKIGIITAGNIPLVGFHDILSVLIGGNSAQIKLSSNDNVLIPYALHLLSEIEPEFSRSYEIVDKLKDYDAVIATGSDNTARYFESYFKHVPHIIRKNRTSVAVLTGNETGNELEGLAQDIMQYYGLGCRNVTKLYLPEGYDLDQIFGSVFGWKEVINHHKYANNYDYHKAVFLMKNDKVTENGFLLLKEDPSLFSPISTVYYEYYKNDEDLKQKLSQNREKIQCTVGNSKDHIPFGKAQSPELWDYADGVDTLDWIINL